MATEENEITLKLSNDEALVLFEFLSRLYEENRKEIFQDQAEEKTLWILEGQLQRILAEPFLPNYIDIIQEARNRIRDEE